MGKSEFKSRVYTERPEYADYPTKEKFQAIQGIMITHLKRHPNAICSYSGGSDSDILIDLIERTRTMFNTFCGKEVLKPVKYAFFNTGLEMQATKRHVKEVAEKYGVEIQEYRPKVNIVQSTRQHGIPFVSKIMSQGLEEWQKKGIPLSIADEYAQAEDKIAKRQELKERYPKCQSVINFLCCCNSQGEPRPNIQLVINSSKYMLDFIREYPPDFQISAKCCDYCKKQIAHSVQKDYEMVITGERRDEGGMRSVPRSEEWNTTNTMCFSETADGKYRFKPLYYVTDNDKAWYKEHYGIRYSDAYEEKLKTAQQAAQNIYKADFSTLSQNYKKDIDKAFKDIPAQLAKLGDNAMKSFVDAMTTNTAYMSANIKTFVNAMVDEFKKDLGIHSPSKVTGQLGSYTGEGFVEGFMDWIPEAERTASKLAEAAKTPIEQLRDAINQRIPQNATAGAAGATAGTTNVTNNYNLTQNNTSPKPLTALETYQARRRQVDMVKALTSA